MYYIKKITTIIFLSLFPLSLKAVVLTNSYFFISIDTNTSYFSLGTSEGNPLISEDNNLTLFSQQYNPTEKLPTTYFSLLVDDKYKLVIGDTNTGVISETFSNTNYIGYVWEPIGAVSNISASLKIFFTNLVYSHFFDHIVFLLEVTNKIRNFKSIAFRFLLSPSPIAQKYPEIVLNMPEPTIIKMEKVLTNNFPSDIKLRLPISNYWLTILYPTNETESLYIQNTNRFFGEIWDTWEDLGEGGSKPLGESYKLVWFSKKVENVRYARIMLIMKIYPAFIPPSISLGTLPPITFLPQEQETNVSMDFSLMNFMNTNIEVKVEVVLNNKKNIEKVVNIAPLKETQYSLNIKVERVKTEQKEIQLPIEFSTYLSNFLLFQQKTNILVSFLEKSEKVKTKREAMEFLFPLISDEILRKLGNTEAVNKLIAIYNNYTMNLDVFNTPSEEYTNIINKMFSDMEVVLKNYGYEDMVKKLSNIVYSSNE